MKSNEEFYRILAQKETGGYKNPYAVVNKQGYMGKYQMGKYALHDVGYYNVHTGKWTGKDGIKSQEDFLKNSQVQEKAIRDYMKKQWEYTSDIHDQVGEVIGNDVLTPSAILAGAHLVGQDKMRAYVKSGGKGKIPEDGNKVPVTEYIRKMGHCDVKSETNGKQYDVQQAEQMQEYLDRFNPTSGVPDGYYEEVVNAGMWPELQSKVLPHIGKQSSQKSVVGSCPGSYPVSGYKTADGKIVEGYTRECWKHSH